jgi:hypothetical protein
MRATEFINEESFGTTQRRSQRAGARPARGHEPVPTYVDIEEHGPTSRKLCVSNVSDDALGASALASCKSQGLRARDGKKSHLIGHGASKVRVTVGGKKIKGKAHGGPLPDYGTRKSQL